jgi:hypothetical protein
VKNYLEESNGIGREDFLGKVGLFKIRANLSIASFLIKVGKGESPEMEEAIKRSLETT